MNEPEVKSFDQCPVCGSTKRFVEELAKETKEAELMDPRLNFHMQIISGAATQPQDLAKAPIGTKVLMYEVVLDVCSDCGCVYAVKLIRREAKKSTRLFGPGDLQKGGGVGIPFPGAQNPRNN